MVKISIIVPIYNAEKYLEQCLQSIKNQTLKILRLYVLMMGLQIVPLK